MSTAHSDSQVFDTAQRHDIIPYQQVLPRIVEEYGRSYGSLMREMMTLALTNHKLSADEYVQLRLFDGERFTSDDKKKFIGKGKAIKVSQSLNAVNTWTGVMRDKVAFANLLGGYGLAVPETLAIYGGMVDHPKPQVLADKAALHGFFANAAFPLFGKPVNSVNSLGSALICAYDEQSRVLTLQHGKTVSLDEFAADIETSFGDGYLLQKKLEPSSQMKRLCGDSVPTVRVLVLDQGDGPDLFKAAVKLTGGKNIADNFWRVGNLLCPVDVATGKMGVAVSGFGIDAQDVSAHPDTGAPIEGVKIADWSEVRELVLSTAGILKNVVITGYDVALTDQGPVIVEANNHPDTVMMQMSERSGIWGPEMKNALAHVEALQKNDARKTARKVAELNRERKEATRQGLKADAA
ncbi:MAG: sugar-transfer associated ATP-grasp domain-containing protein [Pseudomonadota bacterium]